MIGRYIFTLYDINNASASADPLLNVVSAREVHNWQGIHSLVLRIPIYDHQRTPVTTYDSEHVAVFGISNLQEKKYIRVGDNYGSNTGNFIIQSVTTVRDGTDLYYELVAEEERTVQLLDARIDILGDFVGVAALTMLNLIKDVTPFTSVITDIPTTEFRSFSLAYPTALELLNIVINEYSGTTTYYWLASGVTLFIYSESNAAWTTHDSPISYHSNLLGISRDSDAHQLANKVYGAGNDGVLNLAMAGSTRYLNDTASSDITASAGSVTVNLDDVAATTDPVMVDSDIFIEIKNSAVWSSNGTVSWDYKFELLDSSDVVVATLEDTLSYSLLVTNTDLRIRRIMSIDKTLSDVKKIKMTITADNSSPFATSWTFSFQKLGHTNAPNTTTVINSASNTKYGDIHGVVRVDKPSIYNLHNDSEAIGLNATMSGTYTSGLHAGWTKIGTPTVSKNTNGSFFESGGSSQKVVAATIGDGIQIDADPFLKGLPVYAIDRRYSSGFRIYVEKGSVKIKSIKGEGITPEVIYYEEDTKGFGWLTITFESWDSGAADTNWRQSNISLTAAKANTTFYLDSICEHSGGKFMGFTELHTADELKSKADLALEQNRVPTYRYDVDFTDLFSRGDLDKVIYDSAEYSAGNKVRIDDEELGIAKTLRVKSIEYDLLDPTKGKMSLEEDGTQFVAPLAKVIGDIRTNQIANSGARGL